MKVNDDKLELEVGDKVQLIMPHSEVMMHMKFAGTVQYIEVGLNSVRILGESGRQITGPVTHGEAGLYVRKVAGWYVHLDQVPEWARDPDPATEPPVRLMVCTRCRAGRTDVPDTPDMYPSNFGLATVHTDNRPPYSSAYPKGMVYVTFHKPECHTLARALIDPKVEVH